MPRLDPCAQATRVEDASLRWVARIVAADNGGPKRLIISGRRTTPTGTFVSLKAGSRAMPWESVHCELPMLEICEVASPIFSLMAQPHRLEMRVKGQWGPLIYYPDLLVQAASDFVESVVSGEPFVLAARRWRPSGSRAKPRTLIIEVKDDADCRNSDLEYQDKLKLARQVYESIGYGFITVVRSRDIECADHGTTSSIVLDRFTSVSTRDVERAFGCIDAHGGQASLDDVAEVLGGGPFGKAKAAALHVRRTLCIDLSGPLGAHSGVRMVADGRSLLRRRSRH